MTTTFAPTASSRFFSGAMSRLSRFLDVATVPVLLGTLVAVFACAPF